MKIQLPLTGALAMLALSSIPRAASAYDVNAKRSTVTLTSLDDFEQCEDNTESDWCLDGLKTYVKAHPNDAFAAGKHVRLHFNHENALPFFEKRLSKISAEECADEDLGMAVVAGLALPKADPNAIIALKLTNSRCWDALKTRVQSELKDGGHAYRDNVCPILKDKTISAAECAPAAAAKPAAPTPQHSAKLASLDVRSLPLDQSSAMLFRGNETEEVLLVRAKPHQDDVVLVKFKGVRGPWNDHVFATLENPRGSGKDYIANIEGRDRVVMTVRDGSYEIYPKGYDDSLHVYRTSLNDDTKRASSADVMKEFAPPASK